MYLDKTIRWNITNFYIHVWRYTSIDYLFSLAVQRLWNLHAANWFLLRLTPPTHTHTRDGWSLMFPCHTIMSDFCVYRRKYIQSFIKKVYIRKGRCSCSLRCEHRHRFNCNGDYRKSTQGLYYIMFLDNFHYHKENLLLWFNKSNNSLPWPNHPP